MTYFSLAKQFNWLPDEIDRQDPKVLKGLMHVLSVYNNKKNKDIEQANRKARNRR